MAEIEDPQAKKSERFQGIVDKAKALSQPLTVRKDPASAGTEADIRTQATMLRDIQSDLEAAGAMVHVVPMRRLTGSGDLRYWAGYVAAWPVSVVRLVRLAKRVDAVPLTRDYIGDAEKKLRRAVPAAANSGKKEAAA